MAGSTASRHGTDAPMDRLILVEDHPLRFVGLRRLARESRLTVVGEVPTVADADAVLAR